MSDTLIMEKGKSYQIKTTKVSYGNKVIPTVNGRRYKFFITVQDKNGLEATAEYLAKTEYEAEVPFYQGVLQWAKCVDISPRLFTPTIEATEPPQAGATQQQTSQQPHTAPPYHPSRKAIEETKNFYSINIQGSSIAFAMAYAKDLMVAEIARWPVGREVEPADVERMIGYARAINSGIGDSFNFEL